MFNHKKKKYVIFTKNVWYFLVLCVKINIYLFVQSIRKDFAMADIIKREILKGINLYYIPDTKYKTVSMSMYLNRKLKREEATTNALLSKLLTRGTVKCKDMNALSTYADDLYGTLYDVNIAKKAYVQSIVSSVNFLSDDYISENIAKKCTELMLDLIFKPNLNDGLFDSDIVEGEKQNLKDDIEGLINDKRTYANFRCIEEMCQGHENSIFEFGYLEDLEKIDAKTVSRHYKEIITKSPVDIFAVGDIDLQEFVGFIEDYFKDFDFEIEPIEYSRGVVEACDEVRYAEDEFDVAQGKLSMGFTTQITMDDEKYYALLVANSIYGAGAHSRLFNTVREQMSLCYYASSMLDKFRAVMLVSSGIEFEDYEKAKSEIEKQLKNIAKGDFTDEELEVARNYIVNTYLSFKDSAYSMKEYYRSQCFSSNHDTIDEAVEKVRKVKKEDVTDALSSVSLNTVYFLKGKVN